MKKLIVIILIVVGVLVGLYFLPLVTTNSSVTDAGYFYRVPFLSTNVADDGSTVSFQNIRSEYAVQKDLENAINYYETKTCYGITYHYDADNYISLIDYEVTAGFPTKFSYRYEKGDACAAWTSDDAIAWDYNNLDKLPQVLDPEALAEQKYYIITDTTTYNEARYQDFFGNVKSGLPDYIRVIDLTNGQHKVIDIQFLSDGKFKVIIDESRDDNTDVQIFIFDKVEEREDTTTTTIVVAIDEEPIILFTHPIQ